MINDLREFVEAAEALGECTVVENVDWDLEIGSLSEVVAATHEPPMLLFDRIKGYPKGYRVATLTLGTGRRLALALGFPKMSENRDLVAYWRGRLREGMKPVAPVEVATGPVKENVLTGEEVDLYKFPVPKWHSGDGGRYIGTGDMVIMRDPDEGWVNVGTYRVQIHNQDKRKAMIWVSPGHHARVIREKYWAKGKAAPVAVVCGQEPLLFYAASIQAPWGSSEYDYAGWLKNKPIEVTKGVVTDLPIPATAEIVLEGEVMPPEIDATEEGPFGEWTGYYASNVRSEATFRVKAILHRNDPIILGCPPLMNLQASYGGNVRLAAMLWDELGKIVPGVEGVWLLEEARCYYMPVVSIKQMYPGHARQVALAVASSRVAGYHGRFVVVVDDDIDPFNTSEVLWALATRCDPETQIDIARGCWSTPLDPTISPERRGQKDWTNSRALILACKPYHWKDEFPPTFKLSPEEVRKVKEKWQWLFKK